MAIENVRHPIKDTVKADNSTYSSNKIESLIHSATELPETSVADAGDVLMVNEEGEWDKGEIIVPQELPTPAAADIGKIVSVVSDGDEGAEYGLETIPTEVPVPAVADSGKVISVNASGEYELKTPASHFDKKTAGVIVNGATLTPISLSDFSNSYPNEFVIMMVDQSDSSRQLVFRYQGSTTGTNAKHIFNSVVYDNTKVYYYQIEVDKSATSIPAGTTVRKIEIG